MHVCAGARASVPSWRSEEGFKSPCHPPLILLKQALSLNLGPAFSLIGWRSASPREPPVSTTLMRAGVQACVVPGLVCGFCDLDSRPGDCTASALSHWTISPAPVGAASGHGLVGKAGREKGSTLSSAHSSQTEVQSATSGRAGDSEVREKWQDPSGSYLALSWKRGGSGLTPEQGHPESLLLPTPFTYWAPEAARPSPYPWS